MMHWNLNLTRFCGVSSPLSVGLVALFGLSYFVQPPCQAIVSWQEFCKLAKELSTAQEARGSRCVKNLRKVVENDGEKKDDQRVFQQKCCSHLQPFFEYATKKKTIYYVPSCDAGQKSTKVGGWQSSTLMTCSWVVPTNVEWRNLVTLCWRMSRRWKSQTGELPYGVEGSIRFFGRDIHRFAAFPQNIYMRVPTDYRKSITDDISPTPIPPKLGPKEFKDSPPSSQEASTKYRLQLGGLAWWVQSNLQVKQSQLHAMSVLCLRCFDLPSPSCIFSNGFVAKWNLSKKDQFCSLTHGGEHLQCRKPKHQLTSLWVWPRVNCSENYKCGVLNPKKDPFISQT